MYIEYLFILLICLYFPNVSGFYGSVYDRVQMDNRAFGISWVNNNTIYQFAGEDTATLSRSLNTIQFDSEDNLIYNTLTSNASLQCFKCKGTLLPDNRNLFLIESETMTDPLFNNSYYMYGIETDITTMINITYNESDAYSFIGSTVATSVDRQFLYVFGGIANFDEALYGDSIFRIDLNTFNMINLSAQPPNPTYYNFLGCATTLPSGLIVLAMGDSEADYMDTTVVHIFNPQDNTITTQPVSGAPPTPRMRPACNLGPDQSTIYYFGGSDFGDGDFLGVTYNELNILDTTTWTWIQKEIPGLQPYSRVGAVTAVYDDKLVITGGRSGALRFGDVTVLKGLAQQGESVESSNLRWFTNNPDYDNIPSNPTKLSDGAIVGIVIAVAFVLAVILFILYKRMRRFKRLLIYIQNEIIWNPRSGEPFWAESSRLIVRFLLLFLFVAFFVYIIIRAVNSAILAQEITMKTDTVDVPHVRICLSGYRPVYEGESPIDCMLMNGTSCLSHMRPIPFTEETKPRFPYREADDVYCSLFVPPPNFKFVNDDGVYSHYTATQITFSLNGLRVNENVTGVIQADIYAPRKDPNMVVFFGLPLSDTDLSEADIRRFNITETNFEVYPSSFYIPQGDFANIYYNLIEDETLRRDDGWNNVGFSSTYDKTTNLVYTVQNSPEPLDRPPFIGEIKIQPKDYIRRINREQKVFTLLNGFAQAGGVLGLFVALQTILFGFRPQSPWGIVHRWSFGHLRTKLTDRLTNYFNRTEAEVPLVNPVSKRFSIAGRSDQKNNEKGLSYLDEEENMDEETRIKRMEERLQLMELLLKSYYLNDEVFRSLDEAIKDKKRINLGKRSAKVNNSPPLIKSNTGLDSINHADIDSEDDAASNNNFINKENGTNNNRRLSSTVFDPHPHPRGNYQPKLSPDLSFNSKE